MQFCKISVILVEDLFFRDHWSVVESLHLIFWRKRILEKSNYFAKKGIYLHLDYLFIRPPFGNEVLHHCHELPFMDLTLDQVISHFSKSKIPRLVHKEKLLT